jgi:hypothetical protein
MLHNNYEVRVLVKGRPINEYPHNGQTFVEGRDGSNFEIEFKNLSPQRIEVVLSVDGLSVIDGKEAGPQSSGYVVDPYGSIRIPGWKLTEEQVAAFQFAGKKQSYAAQSTGSARNTGVLGALVFAEKRPTYQPVHHQFTQGGMLLAQPRNNGLLFGGVRGPVFGSAGDMTDPAMRGMAICSGASLNNVTTSAVSGMDAVIGASVSNNMSWSGADASERSITRSVKMSKSVEAAEPVQQTLGTAFGEAQDFGTTEVTFNRGDLAAMIVLYYDDSRGLRARGIELTRPSKRRIAPANEPQAFPGMAKGCVPPAGWKG